jgi:cytoskeletal protein RodZ
MDFWKHRSMKENLKSQKGLMEVLIASLVALVGVMAVIFSNPDAQATLQNLMRPAVNVTATPYATPTSRASQPTSAPTSSAAATQPEEEVVECLDDEDGGPGNEACDDDTCWCATNATDLTQGYVCGANCQGAAGIEAPDDNSDDGATDTPNEGETSANPTVGPTSEPGIAIDEECIDEEDGGPPPANQIEACDDDTCWCYDGTNISSGHLCGANCQGPPGADN